MTVPTIFGWRCSGLYGPSLDHKSPPGRCRRSSMPGPRGRLIGSTHQTGAEPSEPVLRRFV